MNVEHFEDLFRNKTYLALKNHLYNYRIRKKAIENELSSLQHGRTIEIGCGISPLTEGRDSTVYLDISPAALTNLKAVYCGSFIAADAAYLPFREGIFDIVVCSEVFEHIQDDIKAVKESSRVLKKGGTLLLTFPHQDFYYSADDRFVGHYRRYSLRIIEEMIKQAGLYPKIIRKIMGPLEKIIMLSAVSIFRILPKRNVINGSNDTFHIGKAIVEIFKIINFILTFLARIDAMIAPRFFSTVLLIRAVKNEIIVEVKELKRRKSAHPLRSTDDQ
jgi:ubiquinone/menaquinone biosynthesis C-methylase UbiE